MNSYLKEAILRQQLKNEIKALLKQNRDDKLSEATLYKAFVEPFTDVLKAVNLAGQDFLNSTITFLRMFITFDPEKHKELIQKHDERRAKIQEKWKPLMDRTDAALSTGDADIVALVLAPHVWAMSAVGQKAVEYGGGAASFLSNVGLGGIVSIASPNFNGLSEYLPSTEDKDGSILDKISTLFLGTVAGAAFLKSAKSEVEKSTKTSKNEGILREEAKKPDLKKDLITFMEDSGIMDTAEKDAKEIFESLKEVVKSIDEDFENKKEMFDQIEKSDNLQDFNEALNVSNNLSESNDSSQNTQKMKDEMKTAVDKLAKSKEFLKQVKEETKKDEVTDLELKAAAEKVVFLDAKQNMEKELGGFSEGIQKYAQSIGESLSEMLPSDNALNVLKKSKSPLAGDIIKFVENTKQKYSIT